MRLMIFDTVVLLLALLYVSLLAVWPVVVAVWQRRILWAVGVALVVAILLYAAMAYIGI